MPARAIPFPFGDCRICKDRATGIHYGVPTCEGCKGFFKRNITRREEYKCFFGGHCPLSPQTRNRCKSCRFRRCLNVGMSVESVKMGRIPKANKERALEEYRRQSIQSADMVQDPTPCEPTWSQTGPLNLASWSSRPTAHNEETFPTVKSSQHRLADLSLSVDTEKLAVSQVGLTTSVSQQAATARPRSATVPTTVSHLRLIQANYSQPMPSTSASCPSSIPRFLPNIATEEMDPYEKNRHYFPQRTLYKGQRPLVTFPHHPRPSFNYQQSGSMSSTLAEDSPLLAETHMSNYVSFESGPLPEVQQQQQQHQQQDKLYAMNRPPLSPYNQPSMFHATQPCLLTTSSGINNSRESIYTLPNVRIFEKTDGQPLEELPEASYGQPEQEPQRETRYPEAEVLFKLPGHRYRPTSQLLQNVTARSEIDLPVKELSNLINTCVVAQNSRHVGNPAWEGGHCFRSESQRQSYSLPVGLCDTGVASELGACTATTSQNSTSNKGQFTTQVVKELINQVLDSEGGLAIKERLMNLLVDFSKCNQSVVNSSGLVCLAPGNGLRQALPVGACIVPSPQRSTQNFDSVVSRQAESLYGTVQPGGAVAGPRAEHDIDFDTHAVLDKGVLQAIGHIPEEPPNSESRRWMMEMECNSANSSCVDVPLPIDSCQEDFSLVQRTTHKMLHLKDTFCNTLSIDIKKMHDEVHGQTDSHPLNQLKQATVKQAKRLWKDLFDAIPKCNKELIDFCKEVPGFLKLDEATQSTLIKKAYFDIWLLRNLPLFYKGDSYMRLPCGACYSRWWMDHFLPTALVDKMFDFVQCIQECNLSMVEILILCSLRLTDPGRTKLGVGSSAAQTLHNHYVDVLVREIRCNHVTDHGNILLKILKTLSLLEEIATLQNASVVNFTLSNLPEKCLPYLKEENDADTEEETLGNN